MFGPSISGGALPQISLRESTDNSEMAGEDHFHHVRDYLYFEVPRFMTSAHQYEKIEDVPWWVINALHLDDPSLDQVNHSLVGKIMIPQPFAGKSPRPGEEGHFISKFMVLQVVVLVLCLLIFRGLASRVR